MVRFAVQLKPCPTKCIEFFPNLAPISKQSQVVLIPNIRPDSGATLRYFEPCLGGSLNDYLLSVILGIVEGVTEFLPVSSTAHLRISEALFHVSLTSGYWKMYTIVIQLGAILCVPIYFRQRIAKFISTFPRGDSGDRTFLTHPSRPYIDRLRRDCGPSLFVNQDYRQAS